MTISSKWIHEKRSTLGPREAAQARVALECLNDTTDEEKIQFESRNSIRITLQNSVRAIFGLVVETKATAKRLEWKLFSESNKSLLKHEIFPSKLASFQ